MRREVWCVEETERGIQGSGHKIPVPKILAIYKTKLRSGLSKTFCKPSTTIPGDRPKDMGATKIQLSLNKDHTIREAAVSLRSR